MATGDLPDVVDGVLPRWDARAGWLLAPLVLFMLAGFVVPLVLLLRMSLYPSLDNQAYGPGLTFENYVELLGSPFIHGIVVYTFQTAVVVTVLTLVVSIPYAYAAWRAGENLRRLLLAAAVITLLTTLVVRLYAVNLILAPNGVLTELLGTVTGQDLQLVNNAVGVLIGQVYITAPYAILAVYSVLVSIDTDLIDAALDLGASRPRAFYEVVLPNALPGIVVAVVISFTWTVGAYSAPVLLGSTKERTFAVQVQELMVGRFDWPAGAALSTIILLVVLVCLVALFTFLGRYGGGDGYLE
jgi:spermidine/putrescine transport system permease protein